VDFGYPFSSDDGWDPHFDRMAFHASVADGLIRRFENDTARMTAEMSGPLLFSICNPYPDEDTRQLELEAERGCLFSVKHPNN
jgi:hypothetical protein